MTIPFLVGGKVGRLLFQDVFVRAGKWFQAPNAPRNFGVGVDE
jgi:hypothetical protein